MENQEEILDVLTVFEKKPSRDIPPVLEDYLTNVAKTGKTLFPWNRLKSLFISKLEQVMEQLNKDMPYDHLPPFPNVENTKYDDMKKRIVEALQKFNGAPFTVQRICELVTEPTKHYSRSDKFLRGIEKNVMVVSTVDPFGRKIVSDSYRGSLVNGLDINGFNQQKADANDINDGQPFTPLPLTDWSNNSLASVWPLAMGNGTEMSKPSFSEQSMCTCANPVLSSNSNDDNDVNVSDEAEVKDSYNDTESADSSEPKTVQNDSENVSVTESNESEITTDSAESTNNGAEVKSSDTDPDLTAGDSMPFSFETKQKDGESEADSTEKLDFSNVTAETSEMEDDRCRCYDNDGADSSELDGPPEKRMKISDDREEVTTSHSIETTEKSQEESAVSQPNEAQTSEQSDVPEDIKQDSKTDEKEEHEAPAVASEPEAVTSSDSENITTDTDKDTNEATSETNEVQHQVDSGSEVKDLDKHSDNTTENNDNVDSASSDKGEDIGSNKSEEIENANINVTSAISGEETEKCDEGENVTVDTTTPSENEANVCEAMEMEMEVGGHSTEGQGQAEVTESGDAVNDEPEPMDQE